MTRTSMTKRMRRSSLLAAIVAALAAFALAACVGIPTSSGVNAGNIVQDRDFRFTPLPDGPQPGSTQQEILTDFMRAATSAEGGYDIAREFLTPEAAEEWNPNRSVLISESAPALVSRGSNAIDYSVVTRASVDSQGVYREDAAQGTQSRSFRFEQVDGEWRISELADGIVLSRANFTLLFSDHSIYFFDPDFEYLIPDLRWFPDSANTPQRIASALLNGQASWLQGATVSAFPEGTTSRVQVEDGVAIVDLNAEAAAASALDRARMLDQLSRSFGKLSSVTSGVTLTAAGAPLPVIDPGASDAVPVPAVDSSPLVRQDSSFGYVSQAGISPLGLSARIIEVNPRAVTLARGKSAAAVLGDGGVYLVAGDDQPLLVDARAELIAPSIDNEGFVWSVPADSPAAIHATGSDGVIHEVASPLSNDGRIAALEVSRDGARVLIYVNTGGGPRLYVSGILRDADGVPSGLTELFELPLQDATPIDATWVDARTVATLAQSGDEQLVTAHTIGGFRDGLNRAENGVQIAGGNGLGQLRVRTAEGVLLQQRASGWQNTGILADLLATQQ